jgi:hypothetical protein
LTPSSSGRRSRVRMTTPESDRIIADEAVEAGMVVACPRERPLEASSSNRIRAECESESRSEEAKEPAESAAKISRLEHIRVGVSDGLSRSMGAASPEDHRARQRNRSHRADIRDRSWLDLRQTMPRGHPRRPSSLHSDASLGPIGTPTSLPSLESHGLRSTPVADPQSVKASVPGVRHRVPMYFPASSKRWYSLSVTWRTLRTLPARSSTSCHVRIAP